MTDGTVARTYPAGVSCWLDLETPDAQQAADFYGGLFGWTLTDAMPPAAPGNYLIATIDGRDVAAIAAGAAAVGTDVTWSTYFAVDDADATASAVTAAGGLVTHEPADNPGGRFAACVDPQGAPFRLWQAGRRLGAQLVNAPGAWNFSDLETTDPQSAIAFYRALFPWHTEDLGGGTGDTIEVDGYGDHLAATSDRHIRERQAGAPAGFADAIGAVRTIGPGLLPHWHVTFSVADRDESAARVEALGGSVEQTLETPWARVARVRDAQGAGFSISQFAPSH